jgi:hypothetical protein
MKKELWLVDKSMKIIRSEDLEKDPDSYGGLGYFMAGAILERVISIPIMNGCSCVMIRVIDQEIADRIVKDDGIDIYSDGYWIDINSPKIKVCYKDTDQRIPCWKGPFA